MDNFYLHQVHGDACYIFGAALGKPTEHQNDPLSQHTDLSKCLVDHHYIFAYLMLLRVTVNIAQLLDGIGTSI